MCIRDRKENYQEKYYGEGKALIQKPIIHSMKPVSYTHLDVYKRQLSYKEGATAVHWSSDGGTEYEIGDGNRTEVGTEITLFLNEESVEFANEYRAREIIEKYCSFMPVEIFLSKANAPQEYETIDESELKEDDVVVAVSYTHLDVYKRQKRCRN